MRPLNQLILMTRKSFGWAKLLFFLAAVLVTASAFNPSRASADVNDFLINEFSADYFLNNTDKQGEMTVKEDIYLTFNGNNHGILRAIPKKYNSQALKPKIIKVDSSTGAPTQFTTSSENSNLVLKIGDPNRTVTGLQHYQIEYSIRNVITFHDSHDELYWDINGTEWGQRFAHVNARIHLPDGLSVNNDEVCFTGSFGQTDSKCTVENDGSIIRANAYDLEAGQTLTIVAGFAKNYFQAPTIAEKIKDLMPGLAVLIVAPFLIGGWAIYYWYKNGRDPAGKSTIIPQYGPPDNLKPAEVGYIADFKADKKDITATIIDLAVRGYIKIIESKKDRLILKDQLEYSLELTNDDQSQLEEFEKIILNGLFGNDKNIGKIIKLNDLRGKLSEPAHDFKTNLDKKLKENNYLISHPLKSRFKLWFLLAMAGVVISAGIIRADSLIVIGGAVAAVITVICIAAMPARTEKGVAAKEYSLGLKMYLQTAEADRIKMMQSPGAKYADNATEPEKTVDFFEKLLPYAVVFNVEKEWAEEFSSIYTQEPSWYQGSNLDSFSAIYLASSLSGAVNGSIASSFSAPQSSSGSGFSGGFAGGGGGGGGGGGW